jgi:hypothetical protein
VNRDRWPFRRPLITPIGWVGIGCATFWVVVCGALYLFIKVAGAR